jgi:hypothetical protein
MPHRQREEFRVEIHNSPILYGAVPQVLHWPVATLVIVARALGTLGDNAPRWSVRVVGLFVQISTGLAILGLVIIGFVWRVGDPPPPPEKTSEVYGQPWDANDVFGLIDIGSRWPADRAFHASPVRRHQRGFYWDQQGKAAFQTLLVGGLATDAAYWLAHLVG